MSLASSAVEARGARVTDFLPRVRKACDTEELLMGAKIAAPKVSGECSSVHHMQRKTDLSRDVLTVFKVIYYALFHTAPRAGGAAYAEGCNAGTVTRHSSASASPANVLRLLFRRDAAKSKGEDSLALSQCDSFTDETTSCRFVMGSPEEDHGSEIFSEKQIVSTVPECPAIGLLTRLDTEVQTLKRKLDRQEDEVKRLTEEVVSLRANAADRSLVRSQKRQARIDASETMLSDGSGDSYPQYVDICPSKVSRDLLKWENLGMFQPPALEAPKHVKDVTPQEKGGGKKRPGIEIPQSPGKVVNNFFWEPYFQTSLTPVKVKSNARRQSMDCKFANFVDHEFVQGSAARSEIEVDEMDNLSMFSYGSADTKDFPYVDSPKSFGRGDYFQEPTEWSSEESKEDHIIHISQSSPRTGTDAGRAAPRRHMQQKYEELEEQLFKILQSPKKEFLPPILSLNSSNPASPGCTSNSPFIRKSSKSGERHDGQSESGLLWEPYRELGSPKITQNAFQKRKPVDDADFAAQPIKTARASESSKSKVHHSPASESVGNESDSDVPRRRNGRIVNSELGGSEFEVLAVPSGESQGSSPAVFLAEESRGQVGIDEVALETFKVCESGEIYRTESSRSNPTESGLYREGRGGKNSGKSHMRRHSSFSQGCRQSRFAVEAARLSMRRQGHHRGVSF
ncbi:hypothetical protein R1flu_007927 [Riccia fluitans]|uniref:Erect panicle 2 protein n=1 Tax=Riccia fluitans TaxID=41844 RepID=A0ABD1Z0F9_9MARC